MKSWKTSLAGIALVLNAGALVLTALTDGKPETVPDWNAFMASAIAGIGLMFARDYNKSSEDHHITTTKVITTPTETKTS